MNCDVCHSHKPNTINRPYVVFTTRRPEDYVPGNTTSGWIIPIYGPICRSCFEEMVASLQVMIVKNPEHPFWREENEPSSGS